MDWSSFIGAVVGGILGAALLIGGLILWDEFQRRRDAKAKSVKPSSLDDILESQLEEYIIDHFDELFPGWRIYDEASTSIKLPKPEKRSTGMQYKTDAGNIDILCLDPDENFVVIELKRSKAPDRVVAQLDRYMEWVERHLIQQDQAVRGLIIAKSLDKRLAYTLKRRQDIDLWAYNLQLQFDKNVVELAS
jgi:hypothetical protein